jgi:uncharacterized protein YjbI with pentapeptide repeats
MSWLGAVGVALQDAMMFDFSGANLQGIDLTGANLQGANLQNADLQGAVMNNANIAGANVFDAVPNPCGPAGN